MGGVALKELTQKIQPEYAVLGLYQENCHIQHHHGILECM